MSGSTDANTAAQSAVPAENVVAPRRLVRVAETDELCERSAGKPPELDVMERSVGEHHAVAETPRRSISFPNTPLHSLDESPSGPFSPSRLRGARAHILNNVRMTRREFYESIGPQKSAFSFTSARSFPLRCTGLASLAAALSYVKVISPLASEPASLTASGSAASESVNTSTRVKFDVDKPLPVTIDRLLQECQLPVSMLTESYLTVHTAFDIVMRYFKCDAELSSFNAIIEPMDLKITEALGSPLDDFDSAAREPAVDLRNLRQRLLETQGNHNFAVVVFYDQQIVTDSLTTEEDEGVDLEMNKSFLAAVQAGSGSMNPDDEAGMLDLSCFTGNRTATEAAIVVGFTRNDRVQLAIPKFSDTRSGMQVMEIALPTLHRGMCAAHPYSGRANGFLVLKRVGILSPPSGTPAADPEPPADGFSLGDSHGGAGSKPPRGKPEPAVGAPPIARRGAQSPRVVNRDFVLDRLSEFGRRMSSTVHTQLSSMSVQAGSHIVAIAMMQAALGESVEHGVDLNSVVAALGCPFEVVTPANVSVEDVASMVRAVLPQSRNLEISVVPFAQNLRKATAPCAMPVAEFQAALQAVHEANQGQVRAVMMVQFDVGFAHWTVDISCPESSRTHWCIVGAFDDENDKVEVIDTHPCKYGFTWTIDVEQLHRAMTNLGYIVVTKEGVNVSDLRPSMESNVVDMAQSTPAYVSPLSASGLGPMGASVLPGAPLSLVGVAAMRANPLASFSAMLSVAPVNLNAMLDDRIGLHDYAAITDEALRRLSIPARVSVHTFNADDDAMQSLERLVTDSVSNPRRALLFRFMPSYVSGYYVRQLKGPAQVCDFALLLGTLGDDRIAVMDPNHAAAKRRWTCLMSGMLHGMLHRCPYTRQQMGAIAIDFDRDAEGDAANLTMCAPEAALRPIGWRLRLNPLVDHALPSIEASAQALTLAGFKCTAEQVLQSTKSIAFEATSIALSDDICRTTASIVAEYGRQHSIDCDVSVVGIDSEEELKREVAWASERPRGRFLVAVYDAALVFGVDVEPTRSAGIIAASEDVDGAETMLHVVEACSSNLGGRWARPAAELAVALRGERFGLLRIAIEDDDGDDREAG